MKRQDGGAIEVIDSDFLDVVRASLQAYADRGVFRGFCETRTSQGKPMFEFVWTLQHRMRLVVEPEERVLEFKRLLPGVPAKSRLYGELKAFLRARQADDLPEHRRVDRERAELSCSNRGGFVSLALAVRGEEFGYGVKGIVNAAHELFVYLRDAWPEYLMENFDVPQE